MFSRFPQNIVIRSHKIVHTIETGNHQPCRAKLRKIMPGTPKEIMVSDEISRYILSPILFVETALYVPLNLKLLWVWFKAGQWDTIVNKLINIQTLCGILFTLTRTIDYFLRQNRITPSFIEHETYCVCWLVFNYFLIYIFQTSHLSMAIFRWVCVKYPLDFHMRYISSRVL